MCRRRRRRRLYLMPCRPFLCIVGRVRWPVIYCLCMYCTYVLCQVSTKYVLATCPFYARFHAKLSILFMPPRRAVTLPPCVWLRAQNTTVGKRTALRVNAPLQKIPRKFGRCDQRRWVPVCITHMHSVSSGPVGPHPRFTVEACIVPLSHR